VLLTWVAPSARADALDKGLFPQAVKIMKDLRDHGYENVGVLKFRVQKGEAPPSLRAGRLNTSLATRLENALILAEDRAHPIGITRGASAAAAAKDLKANYDTPDARNRLFEHAYPLAWGKKEVSVNAFLTGLVKVDPEKGQTTVLVEAFDPKNLDPRPVVEFTVPTDRNLIADLGLRFGLAKRVLNTVEENLDEEAGRAAFAPPKDKVPDKTTVDVARLIDLQIFYDDEKVQIGPDDIVPPPRPGQKVYFELTSKEKVGLVLRVNGINTLGFEKEPREIGEYSFWVLDAGKKYRILGFYPGGKKVQQFDVVPPTKANFAALGDESKLGQIDLDVLLEPIPGQPLEEEKNIRLISLKDVPESAPTLEKLQGQLRPARTRKLVHKGVILPGVESETGPIEEVTFRGRWAGHRTIFYFRPQPAKDENQ
jgi:hypothetical protein